MSNPVEPSGDKPQMLNAKKVAGMIGVYPDTLRRWRREGKHLLSYTRVGGQYRYELADVLRYLEKNKVNVGAIGKE